MSSAGGQFFLEHTPLKPFSSRRVERGVSSTPNNFPRWVHVAALVAATGWAKPPAPGVFCTTYPTAPVCQSGQPACTYCHVAPPLRNAFGAAVEAQLVPAAARPLSDGDFAAALPAALKAVEAGDADHDGVKNLDEVQQGTLPGDENSFPSNAPCAGAPNPRYNVCHYDLRYTYRKLLSDFCGAAPTYLDLQKFMALASDDARTAFLDSELDRCVSTDHWRGKNGQLWKVAHPKIRPVGSVKAGEDQGPVPLADYYDDYALFSWAQTDDHDARDVLTANFFVQRAGSPTTYSKVNTLKSQNVDLAHRSGNMTTAWTLTSFVMFTPLPRNAASQMYRAYLGLDIAKQEGLFSVPNEPRDYDVKGVKADACAACHATLDPLSYVYRNYNGLGAPAKTYLPNRLETLFPNLTPTITQVPESGVIFNKPVANLVEWAQVAANSDAFAVSVVTDYWKLLMKHPPRPEETTEFVQTWQGLKTADNYRVQKMLHRLIRTEAYGAP